MNNTMSQDTPGKPSLDSPVTLEEIKVASEEFFEQYYYVAGQMGEQAKPEDILKVMEQLTGLVMKARVKDKTSSGGPFGFNKDSISEDTVYNDSNPAPTMPTNMIPPTPPISTEPVHIHPAPPNAPDSRLINPNEPRRT